MKDILIIAHFSQLPFEKGYGRFQYIAEQLASMKEYKVELVTSSFSHVLKKQREQSMCKKGEGGYEFKMIYEPGYKKNVSFRRFYSHFIMGRNLKKYLQTRITPDLIYCAIPSLNVAKIARDYAVKNKVKFVIDIQDLWPEAFQMVFHIPVLSKLCFLPFKCIVNSIYCAADEIFAVSNTYANRALEINKKCQMAHTIYLGTKLRDFDIYARNNRVHKNADAELWMGYCGSLSNSYDLLCVLDALNIISEKGVIPPKFFVMGDGARRKEFEAYATRKQLDVVFTGRLSYEKMCGLLSSCDFVVNPIVNGSVASIINKHGDYAASGLPVLNTQESAEYRDLVNKYYMGFNCENGNSKDLANKILVLMDDKRLRIEMGKNARRCAEEKFDRENSYQEITDTIKNCLMKK